MEIPFCCNIEDMNALSLDAKAAVSSSACSAPEGRFHASLVMKTSPFDGTIPTKMRSSFAQLRYSMSPSSLSVSVCSSPVSTKSSSSSNSESSPGRNDTQLPVSELTPSSSSTSIL
ncbi:hypothetical protein RvY_06362-1 [Ramazzottius varieornatus]|uniref:Uncharacterized protein n=1 Tax=Ramazzottius varieornatus TaxID=947166 RepID=A0A1D1V1T0_RAMVA|nr:hypothetical protein RvY_06362-1 [Ramazzottius varieornatus]